MQNQNSEPTFRDGFNLAYMAISGYATCFTVFTRHSFGVEALAWRGPAAIVVMLGFTMGTGSPRIVEFLGIWLLAVVLQRILTFARLGRGRVCHTRYEGYPWLGFMVPLVRRVETAKLVEFLVCLAGGTYLFGFDERFGGFVLLGSFSLLLTAAMESAAERKTLRRMRDAELEMRYFADRFNRGDF